MVEGELAAAARPRGRWMVERKIGREQEHSGWCFGDSDGCGLAQVLQSVTAVRDNVDVPNGTAIPSVPELLWPTLRALESLGGSGTIQEVLDKVIKLQGFSEQQQAISHLDGPRTELEYRLAWARTYLKAVGAIDKSTRGVWSITDAGQRLDEDDMAGIPGKIRAAHAREVRVSGKKRLLTGSRSCLKSSFHFQPASLNTWPLDYCEKPASSAPRSPGAAATEGLMESASIAFRSSAARSSSSSVSTLSSARSRK